jgi:RecA/RadA recombinase
MDKELTEVIEDFSHAVNVETLYLVQKNGKHSLSWPGDSSFQPFHVDQEVLLKQLNPVETNHDQERLCLDGTRQSILQRIMDWVPNAEEGNNAQRKNVYWVYGSPGIGKTSLAHSICARLQDRGQLAGAYFCQRDKENLSEPRNILPTLIYKLARAFPAFRGIAAEHLRKDPNLTPQSMKYTLFVDFIRAVHSPPKQHTLVFVIDALDECNNTQSRRDILKVLTDAAALASWLKIIITSRPEADIIRCFLDTPEKFDLGTDQETKDDLRTFARSQFASMVSEWHLPPTWPEESLFNRVISQANGLFIFIKTLVLSLQQSIDAEESLKESLEGSAGAGLESLHGLYTSILKAQMMRSNIAEFWRVVAVITTAQYRPLREEPIAALAGVKRNLVKKWVDDLSSLLYRDEGANGGIRVRHLSISEYFVSDRCDYQGNLEDAHAQLGVICLETMVGQLRFNICKLEDSRLANADIKDLQSRIERSIPESLQYSCLYWSTHLCMTPNNDGRHVLGFRGLKKFFEGLCPLFWIEVLSIMRMVPIGAPNLRRVISWVKVSTAPAGISCVPS